MLGHPEIIVFGLNSAETMAQIINSIGEAVRSVRQRRPVDRHGFFPPGSRDAVNPGQ